MRPIRSLYLQKLHLRTTPCLQGMSQVTGRRRPCLCIHKGFGMGQCVLQTASSGP
jgi:hypothetical protein